MAGGGREEQHAFPKQAQPTPSPPQKPATAPAGPQVDFIGDAQLMLTAPFYPGADPLDQRPDCTIPAGGTLDSNDRIIPVTRPMDQFMRGSMTYGNPPLDYLTHFVGAPRFELELTEIAEEVVGLPLQLKVTGILFPDGYGSVALRMTVADGWDAHRERVIEAFGPSGRDPLADRIRELLLPTMADLSDRCCPQAPGETRLPYFNLTYVAQTSLERPGRATLPDELRQLVYPRSPAPIASDSSWSDEFFYAGYAFSLLASPQPEHTLDQLEHLLLYLDVLYARMDRTAVAADRVIRESALGEDIELLIAMERRLRADYQALVRPTFSYDYHVLKLRDSFLYAWETDKTRERADTLLQMARQAVERKLEQDQARRVARVNLIVTILTILSLVASADAAVDLWTRMF